MKIISIIAKNEINNKVEFDNGEYLFLTSETIFKFGLRKGDDIGNDIYEQLLEENKKYFIREKALSLLARRPHSAFELKVKLQQRKFDFHLIDEVIELLKKNNLLNDSLFVEKFIAEKISKKNLSIRKIESELIKKGINRNIIKNEIAKIEENNFEYESALKSVQKKIHQLKNRGIEGNELNRKIYSYLASKGYDYDVINKIVNEFKLNQDL